MDKKLIAGILRDHRTASSLSVQAVIARLNEKGISISEKTLYGYENGISTPNVSTFIALCDIYKIDDIIGTVSGTPHATKIEKSTLAIEEWQIDQYNDFLNADLYGKIFLLMKWGIPSFSGYEERLESLFPSNSEQANFDILYTEFMKLNETGQGVAMGRIFEIAQNKSYLKDTHTPDDISTKFTGTAG